MPSTELTKTDAVTVRRKRERADYRRESANAILDEAIVAHVGIAGDGQPFVIPMAFGRDGDRLIPVRTEFGEPIPEPDLRPGIAPTASVSPYARPNS